MDDILDLYVPGELGASGLGNPHYRRDSNKPDSYSLSPSPPSAY